MFDIRAIRRGRADDPEIAPSDVVVVGLSNIKSLWRDAVVRAARSLRTFSLQYLIRWHVVAGANIVNRIANVQMEIRAGVQAGTISRAEAQPLREQLRQLRQLQRRYSANGLTNVERQDLQRRIQTLRQQVRYASRANVGNRYGSADWIDRNRDGYDDRDTDRDGIWTDNYGQGGPLEEVQQCAASPGGIAGIFNSVLGRNSNTNCTLRVGQRATAALYGVPVDLSADYRDGNGVYYRSDGRNIYQIDARTNVVLRVYDID